LTGFYLLFTGRRLPKRPEDDKQGEIYQGTGELASSARKLVAAVRGLAGGWPRRMAVGWWLFPDRRPAVMPVDDRLRVSSTYRGQYAH